MTLHGVLRGPAEITFGRGAARSLGSLVASLGRRAAVCTDAVVMAQPHVAAAFDTLREAGVETVVFDGAEPELPLHCVEQAVAAVGPLSGIDVVVGIGGGSAIDLAKLVALLARHPGPLERYYGENAVPGPCLPVVALPTTAGTGSEVTPVAVIGDPSRELKVGISSPHLIPRLALCDPELTLTCPPSVTAFSGIDALAHAVEAFTSSTRAPDWSVYPRDIFQGKNPFSDAYALVAAGAISRSLERAVSSGDEIDARESMLYGSLHAGLAFGNAGTGGAHALQYAVGAASHTPHGLGVGLLLPYVLSYTRSACAPELRRLAEAFGVAEPDPDEPRAAIDEIVRLAAAVGVPRTLAEIGIAEDALPHLADQASGIARLLRNSPRPLDRDALLEILQAAHRGELLGLPTTNEGAR
ncbi:MAG TPA: iron-containing alcohol dehydrogenase [Gaiellales bacterium]|jgi:alcohol dehydrogenase